MNVVAKRIAVTDPGWDDNVETRYFSQPYGLIDGLEWIFHVLIKPPGNHPNLEGFIPRDCRLNAIEPRIRLALVGDIMVLNGQDFGIGEDVRAFVRDADFLLANFEGTLDGPDIEPVFMGQTHAADILDLLAGFFPPSRTVLSCANNHAGDYGREAFDRSCRQLRERGFAVVGRRDEPAALLDGTVNVAACTYWSNQPCRFVASAAELGRYRAAEAKFNLLFPHWGYEMQLYPKTRQIREARALLAAWDMIVGHHSHCPQPAEAHRIDGNDRLLAYSLGNFCVGGKPSSAHSGMILKLELGPDAQGRWAVGETRWRFLELGAAAGGGLQLGLAGG